MRGKPRLVLLVTWTKVEFGSSFLQGLDQNLAEQHFTWGIPRQFEVKRRDAPQVATSVTQAEVESDCSAIPVQLGKPQPSLCGRHTGELPVIFTLPRVTKQTRIRCGC